MENELKIGNFLLFNYFGKVNTVTDNYKTRILQAISRFEQSLRNPSHKKRKGFQSHGTNQTRNAESGKGTYLSPSGIYPNGILESDPPGRRNGQRPGNA
jgi:hypothetical protein